MAVIQMQLPVQLISFAILFCSRYIAFLCAEVKCCFLATVFSSPGFPFLEMGVPVDISFARPAPAPTVESLSETIAPPLVEPLETENATPVRTKLRLYAILLGLYVQRILLLQPSRKFH